MFSAVLFLVNVVDPCVFIIISVCVISCGAVIGRYVTQRNLFYYFVRLFSLCELILPVLYENLGMSLLGPGTGWSGSAASAAPSTFFLLSTRLPVSSQSSST